VLGHSCLPQVNSAHNVAGMAPTEGRPSKLKPRQTANALTVSFWGWSPKWSNPFLQHFGFGPESAKHLRSPQENGSPDPPSGPPGGRGDKNKFKSTQKCSWWLGRILRESLILSSAPGGFRHGELRCSSPALCRGRFSSHLVVRRCAVGHFIVKKSAIIMN
jgi:hypothetical protein